MVDSINPTFGTLSTKNNPYKPGQAAKGVESHGDDKPQPKPVWNRVERRMSGDRRRQGPGKYANFEMRHSTGRRKTDRNHPSIQTKA